MAVSPKTTSRLVAVSLFFSLLYLIFNGFTLAHLLLVAVFTATVFVSVKLFSLLTEIESAGVIDIRELKFFLGIFALLFVSIATFTYSMLFGLFYGLVFAVYAISPQDRAWISGSASLAVQDNKVFYRQG